MGAILNVNDPEFALVIQYSFTDLEKKEGWVGLAVRVDREICMTFTGNRTWVSCIVAQWFTH